MTTAIEQARLSSTNPTAAATSDVVARMMTASALNRLNPNVRRGSFLPPTFPDDRLVWVVYVDGPYEKGTPFGQTIVFQGYMTVWDVRTHARLAFATGDGAAIDPNVLASVPAP